MFWFSEEYLQYLLHGRILIEMYFVVLNTYSICYTAGSWLRCTVWRWIPTVSVTQQDLDWDVLCGAEYLQYLLHSRILIEMYCVALNTYSICYTAGSWLRCTVWRWIPTVSVTRQDLDWDVLCGAEYLQYLLHGRILIEMYCVALNTYSICYTAGSWLRCTVWRWIPTVSVTRQDLDWDGTVWRWIPTVSVTRQDLDWDVLSGAEYLQYLLHSRLLIEMYCVALNTYSICYTAGSWLRCTVWRWIPTVSVTQQVLDWDVLCGAEYLQYLLRGRFLIEMYCVALNTYSICYAAGSWLRCTVWRWIPTVSVTRQVLDWDVLCGAEYLQYLLHSRFLIEMYCVALNTYSICYTAGSWLRCTVWRWIPTVSVTRQALDWDVLCGAEYLQYLLHSRFLIEMYCVALNTYSICYTAGSWLRCTVWRWIPTVSVTRQVLDWDVLCGAEYLQYLLHSRFLIEMYCVALNTYSICYTAGSWLRCTVWRGIPTVSVTQQVLDWDGTVWRWIPTVSVTRQVLDWDGTVWRWIPTVSVTRQDLDWDGTVWRWIPTVSVTQQVLDWDGTVWRWIPTVSVTQQVLDWDVLCGAEYLQYLLHSRFLIEMYCVALTKAVNH